MSSRTIFLVDYVSFLRGMLKLQLGNLDFHNVAAYVRARDALAVLEAGIKNLYVILCNLPMPDMNGIEFRRNPVRIEYRNSILVMSGEGQRIIQTEESLASAQELNVLGALQKSITIEQLQSMLASARPSSNHSRSESQANHSLTELRTTIAMAKVEVSLNMAKSSDMTTVAEGIEDQADCDSLLQKMGVDLVQSYFVAKQMPAEDLRAWLSA